MHFTLGQMAGEILPLELRRSVFAAVPGLRPRANAISKDLVTARSLASVGLTVLFSLPLLIAASLLLEAPLAGPAVIALGYLASAHAVAERQQRRAAVWTLAILLGFVGWTLAVLVTGEGLLTWPGLTAALFAPFLAAAPAFARHLILARPSPATTAAAGRAACLNQLAPAEAVLFLDKSGSILAATLAGLKRLDLPANASDGDLMRRLHLLDRPVLLDALARCQTAGVPVEIRLRLAGGVGLPERCLIATIAADKFDAATLQLRDSPAAVPAPAEAPAAGDQIAAEAASAMSRIKLPAPVCNIGEALAFALRQAGGQAQLQDINLIREGEADVIAACDRNACRRILTTLVTTAIGCSPRGGTVCVSARRASHATLVRISLAAEGSNLRDVLSHTGVAEAVDRMGGSMIIEECEAEARIISVRLVPAEAKDRSAQMLDASREG